MLFLYVSCVDLNNECIQGTELTSSGSYLALTYVRPSFNFPNKNRILSKRAEAELELSFRFLFAFTWLKREKVLFLFLCSVVAPTKAISSHPIVSSKLSSVLFFHSTWPQLHNKSKVTHLLLNCTRWESLHLQYYTYDSAIEVFSYSKVTITEIGKIIWISCCCCKLFLYATNNYKEFEFHLEFYNSAITVLQTQRNLFL